MIATLKTLGAEGRLIFQVYLIQIAVLTVIGVVLGLVLGAAAPLLFAPLIEARLPVPTSFAIYPMPLVEAALYGALTALLFTLWPLARTEQIRAAALYRDLGAASRAVPRPFFIVVLVGVMLALVGVAALLSGLAMLWGWALRLSRLWGRHLWYGVWPNAERAARPYGGAAPCA